MIFFNTLEGGWIYKIDLKNFILIKAIQIVYSCIKESKRINYYLKIRYDWTAIIVCFIMLKTGEIPY
jgi:hypothetical protein